MSHPSNDNNTNNNNNHLQDDHQEHDNDDEQIILQEEDIVEVHEDDGDEHGDSDEDGEEEGGGGRFEPMDEDDYNDDSNFDGEIIIGGPGPGEEEVMEDMDGERGDGEMLQRGDQGRREDNSWGATALHVSEQSIFAIAQHPFYPNPPLVVTGGEDDMGYIFSNALPSTSTSTSNSTSSNPNDEAFPPIKLTGHGDSIIAVGWSFDGEMVATGGMDGKIRVWRRVKGGSSNSVVANSNPSASALDAWKHWEFLTTLDTGDEIAWMTWHPKGNVLAAGCEDSSVWMWQLPSGNTMTVLSGHTLPTTAGIFPPPGKQLLTTSLDSTLILWDPRTSTPIFKSSIFCPPNSPNLDPAIHGITSLAVSPNGQLAAVGGSNGGVRLVNLSSEKGDTVGRFEGHKEGESVEALVFVDLLNGAGGGKGVVVVSGATDGKGFVWDVATGRVRAELSHDEPITSIYPHPLPALHLVTTASADFTLKTWDIRTGQLIATHEGHVGVVNGLVVGPAPPQTQTQTQDQGQDGTSVAQEAGGQIGQIIMSAGDEGVSLTWRI